MTARTGLCACGRPGCSDGGDQVAPVRDGVQPGIVAMVKIGGDQYGPAFWDDYNGQWVDHKKGRLYPEGMVPEIRPLLVIDPEDREQVERLAMAHGGVSGDAPLTGDLWSIPGLRMQAALRSMLTPPGPEEPQGLGAVVEDVEGTQFVRMHDGWWHGGHPVSRNWAAINVVRVLSTGVGEAE